MRVRFAGFLFEIVEGPAAFVEALGAAFFPGAVSAVSAGSAAGCFFRVFAGVFAGISWSGFGCFVEAVAGSISAPEPASVAESGLGLVAEVPEAVEALDR